MTRRRHKRRTTQAINAPVAAGDASSTSKIGRWSIWASAGVIVIAGALWAGLQGGRLKPGGPHRGPASESRHYVGRTTCATCHAEQQAAWTGSHHDLAMQEVSADTVLGDFDDANFTHSGVTTRFFRRDGKYIVRTDGSDGALADFEVRYVFGVEPLQQYLLELPGGRLQALSIAWDTRPGEQGGQRWYHLYPDETIRHDDELHWTGMQQNWNHMCAECHSTNLKRNYDAVSRTYKTTWSEIDVSCESCHGPGSKHVAWARHGDAPNDNDDGNKGLIVRLDERRNAAWTISAASGKPVRSSPRSTSRELDICARCHSRRGQIWDDYVAGKPIGDTHRVALLDAGLYFPDGQIRDEVYEHGSFLQSRMHQAGVTCSDCHDPHSQKLRAPAGEVCLTCHQAAKYQNTGHHHHEARSTGSQCIECHMPGRTYMGIDNRRDHSLRIPRPDLAESTGAPDACTSCHKDRKSAWAAGMLREWHGSMPVGLQRYAEVLHDGDMAAAGVRPRLLALARDETQPGIARASALLRLDQIRGPNELNALGVLLRDRDPLVRRAAVSAHQSLPADARAGLLPALEDAIRDVRLDAVPLIAGIPAARLKPEQLATRDRAIAEYVASQQVNAERPESHVNLGLLWATLGRPADARAAYELALSLDPRFVPAAVNLADLHRSLGQESDAESVLARALESNPREPALHHAMGLLLVRTGRSPAALNELKLAAELPPGSARYAYVYAVALDGAGRRPEAIRILRASLRQQPNDRDTLWALTNWLLDEGKRAQALEFARQLASLEPDDPDVRTLLDRANPP
jgi:tetratricopeptide (TPR) repeat protein